MAGMGLSGGFAAGGGADALEEVLKRAFLEQTERRRAKQEDRRIGQEDTRLAQQAEIQKANLSSMDESRKAAAEDRAQKMLMGKLSLMAPGSQVDPGLAAEGRSAGLGPMLPHEAADLPSTAISGMAQAGAKAPLMGQLRMAAAGRPERDTFTGTDEQLTAQQGRQDALSRTAQARTDREADLARAAQDRKDAASESQKGREELVRLAASMRTPSAASQGNLSPTAEANLTTKLAGDWQKVSSPAREMDRQFNLMQTGLRRFHEGDKNGGSQAVLVTFQKILDPTSVVRESEYARSAEGVSMLQRMQGYAEKLKSGGAGVPESALQEMVKTAEQFTANSRRTAEGQRTRLKAFADHYKIPHELVFDDTSPADAPVGPAAPKADLIWNGKAFVKGGT